MNIYISGKISGTTDYLEKFENAEKKIKSIFPAHDVINPAKINSFLPKSTTYDTYMNMSYMLLDMCEIVIMLPDWETSKGACIEFGYAKARDKSILMFNEL